MPSLKLVGLVAALALSTGCVSKAKYQQLDTQYTTGQQRLNKLQADNARLTKIIQTRDRAAQARLDAYRALVKELKPLVDQGVLEVTVDDGRVVIGMASDVLFESGSAELSPTGRSNVVKVGKILVRRTERDLQIQGHTDSDPISSSTYSDNWQLGAARALAVVSAMTAAGVPADRLSAATYADNRPVVPNDSDTHKARNRRIEIVIEPDFSDLPGFQKLMDEVKNPRPLRIHRKPKPRPKK
ncbi:MAG: OmpA family protein [Oligoflexia bacterium]|nr:OmpA family protein [Oligoflexia bacterium]